MAKELLIRKQKGTHSPQCTSYRIVEPSWRFTLETCDEDVTGVIKDDVGNTIATVSAGAPAIVSRLGLYNVCVTGNGMGALYVEWTSDTYVDQQCCNEVRKEFEQMLDDAIANVESKIPTSSVTVRGGENVEVTKSGNTYTVNATDTVTTLKAGNGISLQRNGYEYTVSSKVANIVAGENVSIEEGTESDGSPRFEISATDTKPDVDKAYVDAAIASVPRPDVDKAYVDQQIAAIEDKDTVTTLVAGTGISITDSGTGGNHNYTVTGSQGASASGDSPIGKYFGVFNNDSNFKDWVARPGTNINFNTLTDGNTNVFEISANNSITTLRAGDNITIADSGTGGNHVYTVSATGGGGGTDTVTTLTAGNGISISDSGTDGNHQYTVNGVSSILDASQGSAIFGVSDPTKTGRDSKYEVYAGDNVTLKAVSTGNGTGISINADDTKTTLTAGNGISITDSGTDGNHNYTVTATGSASTTTVASEDNNLWVQERSSNSYWLGLNDNLTFTRRRQDYFTDTFSIGTEGIVLKSKSDGVTYWSTVVNINNEGIYSNYVTVGNMTIGEGEINNLTNMSWDDNDYISGRAATEDQLKVLADRIAALEARL